MPTRLRHDGKENENISIAFTIGAEMVANSDYKTLKNYQSSWHVNKNVKKQSNEENN